MTATADQKLYFRHDLGDAASAFTDPWIDELFTRAAAQGYTNTATVEAWVRVLAIDQLLADAASSAADYSQNQSSEKLNQVYTNLMKLRGIWTQRLADAMETEGSVVQWGKPIRKPSRIQEFPDTR